MTVFDWAGQATAYVLLQELSGNWDGRPWHRHGQKGGGCCAPFAESWDPANTVWPGPMSSTSVPTNGRLHPSSRFATVDMNRKLGAVLL